MTEANMNAGPACCKVTQDAIVEQERAVVEMVLRYMREARQKRACGTLTFELGLNDGGVTHRWASPRYKEK